MRHAELAVLEDAPCEVEEADEKLLIVEVVPVRQLLVLLGLEDAIDLYFNL